VEITAHNVQECDIMVRLSRAIRHLVPCVVVVCTLLLEAVRLLRCCLRPPAALAAENLFLRKQLALYRKRHVKPRRATGAMRVALVWLSQWFDWPQALTVVQPETFRRWQRQRLRLFWRRPLCPGRPRIPLELQALIRQMSRGNLTWGQRRIANELRLKLGLQVSPRTVRKYMPSGCDRGPGPRVQGQRWRTFMRNHVAGLIRSDLSTVVIRGWQVFSTRGIELLLRWQGRVAAGAWRGVTPSEAPSMFSKRRTRSLGLADVAPLADVPQVAERSPPALRPSRIHHMSEGTPVRMSNVCPVELARDQGTLARSRACGAAPWCQGRIPAVRWRRVA
jgi:hypothetical protein